MHVLCPSKAFANALLHKEKWAIDVTLVKSIGLSAPYYRAAVPIQSVRQTRLELPCSRQHCCLLAHCTWILAKDTQVSKVAKPYSVFTFIIEINKSCIQWQSSRSAVHRLTNIQTNRMTTITPLLHAHRGLITCRCIHVNHFQAHQI